MRPDLVVVSAPSLQLFGRIRKRQELVCVQALGPEAPVEGFDEGVVRRLAGPAEVQGDAVGIGPQVQVPGDELGPLIDPDGLRIAQPAAGPVQGLDHVFRPVGEPRIDHRREAAEGVDHGQDPDLAARRQLVVDDPKGGAKQPILWPRFRSAVSPRIGPRAAWPSPAA
jgi:hypothetical protein